MKVRFVTEGGINEYWEGAKRFCFPCFAFPYGRDMS